MIVEYLILRFNRSIFGIGAIASLMLLITSGMLRLADPSLSLYQFVYLWGILFVLSSINAKRSLWRYHARWVYLSVAFPYLVASFAMVHIATTGILLVSSKAETIGFPLLAIMASVFALQFILTIRKVERFDVLKKSEWYKNCVLGSSRLISVGCDAAFLPGSKLSGCMVGFLYFAIPVLLYGLPEYLGITDDVGVILVAVNFFGGMLFFGGVSALGAKLLTIYRVEKGLGYSLYLSP